MDIIAEIKTIAKEDPNRPAFVFRREQISYGELWKRSCRLALHLLGEGLDPKQPIPVYGHKSVWMPVCFLACSLSGHTYVPMDVNMPDGRITDIVDAVASPLVLATEELTEIRGAHQMNRQVLEEICLGDARPAGEDISWPGLAADDIHYMIFTSGSTGKPKGVKVTHANLNAYLSWSPSLVEGRRGIFLNQAPFSFDLSVMDTYTGLATGSTVVCLDRDLIRDVTSAVEFIQQNGVHYWVSTPSFADLVMGEACFDAKRLPELSHFLFCGEPLTPRTVRSLRERFPDARIINTYGPTETTVCVTAAEITDEILKTESLLPVGYAKPGTEIYAADAEGRRLPGGQVGELIINGDTVAAGYYHNDKQTAEHFFRDEEGIASYRTGDMGYVRKDGMVYCSGRADGQVKLHGYRIELGDIEKNLLALEGVDGAVVLPKMRDGVVHSLAALVLQKEGWDSSYARRKYIRQSLGERVPSYMVPKKVVLLNAFPMTMNGKLDRKALEELI